jgi:hypothetical protein
MPAYVVKAQNEPVAPVAVRRPAVTARPVHHVVVAAAAPVVTTRHVQFRHLPVACTNDGVGAGCAAPTAPTLYVQLPGHRDIGVSTNLAPMDCAVLPMTPLTHCQPSDRNQS